ncbi:hypothetical protein PSTT_07078 [Puccinia striiformis]|uniref:Uncharacterized protein n=1 Tax=Puccinia striiformis TaxID=27350 RepID=A0A2S4VHL5_9BASI|nr:hypothetical protein PSTT_07078 [Puccinia striiformis]
MICRTCYPQMNPCQVDATAETNGGHSNCATGAAGLQLPSRSNCATGQCCSNWEIRFFTITSFFNNWPNTPSTNPKVSAHQLILPSPPILVSNNIEFWLPIGLTITMEGHGGGDTWASMRDEYQPQTNPHPLITVFTVQCRTLSFSVQSGWWRDIQLPSRRQSFQVISITTTKLLPSQPHRRGGHSTGTQGDGGHTYSNPHQLGHWAAMYLVIQMDCKAIAIFQEGRPYDWLKVVGAVPSQAPHPLGHWAAMVPLTAVVLVQSVPCESAPPAPHPLRNGTKAANSFPMTSALRVILIGNQPPVAAIQAGLANTPETWTRQQHRCAPRRPPGYATTSRHSEAVDGEDGPALFNIPENERWPASVVMQLCWFESFAGTPQCPLEKAAAQKGQTTNSLTTFITTTLRRVLLSPELDSYGRQSSLKNAGGKTPYALVKDALDAQSTGWLETNLSVKWREDGELVEKVEQAIIKRLKSDKNTLATIIKTGLANPSGVPRLRQLISEDITYAARARLAYLRLVIHLNQLEHERVKGTRNPAPPHFWTAVEEDLARRVGKRAIYKYAFGSLIIVKDRALWGNNATLAKDITADRAALPTNEEITAKIAQLNGRANEGEANDKSDGGDDPMV